MPGNGTVGDGSIRFAGRISKDAERINACPTGGNPSVTFGDSSLRRARSAALTAHRAVIHYRRLRFAYPLHRGAFGGTDESVPYGRERIYAFRMVQITEGLNPFPTGNDCVLCDE